MCRLLNEIDKKAKTAVELVANLDKLVAEDDFAKYKVEFEKIDTFNAEWKTSKLMAEKRCREHKRDATEPAAKSSSSKKEKKAKKSKKASNHETDDELNDDDADLDGLQASEDE